MSAIEITPSADAINLSSFASGVVIAQICRSTTLSGISMTSFIDSFNKPVNQLTLPDT
ncbi:hypothetical protein HCA47_06240 [Listeria ivanovii]|nr:hypothetical protein [Listeria ivanovii]MBK3914425.1 hypothetical protein [Listeria ivanovii subsp. ivanovii]MBK3926840.1 hypothetical protein [Listeria ivanovii subsp. ivanovii]